MLASNTNSGIKKRQNTAENMLKNILACFPHDNKIIFQKDKFLLN